MGNNKFPRKFLPLLVLLGFMLAACSHADLPVVEELVVDETAKGSDPALEKISTSMSQDLAQRPKTTMPVLVEEDVSYSEGRTLDIYAPEEIAAWPIVFILHGSAQNSKTYSELGYAIASNGVIVFVPTWSANPPQSSAITKGWDEVACALRFAQEYIEGRDINNPRVVIIGHSVGGASGFITMVAGDELPGACPSNASLPNINGFISIDGVFSILDAVPASRLEEADPGAWERINPYHYLDESHFRENIDLVFLTSMMEEYEKDGLQFMEALAGAGYTAVHVRMPELDHYGVVSPYPQVMDLLLDVIYPGGDQPASP